MEIFTFDIAPVLELSAASDFHFSATASACATRLGRLGKPLMHFFLVGEQLLDARRKSRVYF